MRVLGDAHALWNVSLDFWHDMTIGKVYQLQVQDSASDLYWQRPGMRIDVSVGTLCRDIGFLFRGQSVRSTGGIEKLKSLQHANVLHKLLLPGGVLILFSIITFPSAICANTSFPAIACRTL